MSGLLSIGTRAKSINAIQIVIEVLNRKETKEFLVSLNIWDQLYDKGEDKEGVKLSGKSGLGWVEGGEYSENTINGTNAYPGKTQLGLPTNRVTLYHSGDFYNTFKVEVEWPFVIFEADDNKGGERLTDLLQNGVKILGLNDENKAKVEEYLIEKVIDEIFDRLFS